jgi:hypothetical protein
MKKMKWEKPKLLLLNNNEIAYGAVCSNGVTPGGGSDQCVSGISAALSQCRDGASPGKNCHAGTTP